MNNWSTEAARFAPKLRVLDFSQPDRWDERGDELARFDLVLTTYALIRRDAIEFTERDQHFRYVILDEALRRLTAFVDRLG